MHIAILDTEGISLDKPFTYDIGYIICEVKGKQLIEVKRQWFLVEQIFNNTMLFATAYYGKKRPRYLQMRKNKTIKMQKMKDINTKIIEDIEEFNIEGVYAFNSPYDENSVKFTSEWFKLESPFKDIPFYDIWAYADIIHQNYAYRKWCEKNGKVSNANNVVSNAETTYQFLINDTMFTEQHTSIEDCEIEKEILEYCLKLGRVLGVEYKRENRNVKKQQQMTILYKRSNGEKEYYNFKYTSKRKNQKLNGFILEE